MFIESMMPSNHLILCCPLLLPSVFPSLPVSQLFASGGQSIGASTSPSVPPTNMQGSFPLVWTGLISMLSKELSRVFSNTTVQKHQFFGAQPSLWFFVDFPGGSDGKASAYNAGDPGSIPGLGRSSGEGHGNPLQYSCLDNHMDGGAL